MCCCCSPCNKAKATSKLEDWYTKENEHYCEERFVKLKQWCQLFIEVEPKRDPYEFLRERAMKVADEMEDHRNERDVNIGRRAIAGEKPATVREKMDDRIIST